MTGASEQATQQLRSLIERVERLHEERRAIADDIREVYKESKDNGFDVKAMKAVVRIREQDQGEREEHEAIVNLYLSALGQAPVETGTEPATRAGAHAHTHEANPNFPAPRSYEGDGGHPLPSSDPDAQNAGVAAPVEQAGESRNLNPGQSEQPADLPPLPAFLRRDKQARSTA